MHDAHVFASMQEVEQICDQCHNEYNEERPHKSLNNLQPSVYIHMLRVIQQAGNYIFNS